MTEHNQELGESKVSLCVIQDLCVHTLSHTACLRSLGLSVNGCVTSGRLLTFSLPSVSIKSD